MVCAASSRLQQAAAAKPPAAPLQFLVRELDQPSLGERDWPPGALSAATPGGPWGVAGGAGYGYGAGYQ